MTGTVATAFSAAFRPSPPRGKMRSTTPSCVASSASSSRPPPATSPIAPSGTPAAHGGLGGDRGEHGVGVRRRRRAAQHDGVAGLQAQRGGVDRDVRARLVDDRDDAERHAQPADVEAVGQPPALDDLADGVGQRRDRPRARRRCRRSRSGSSARRSSSAASRPAARPSCMSRALASTISSVRAMSASAIASSAAFFVSVSSAAEGARRVARGEADVGDAAGHGRHGDRVRQRMGHWSRAGTSRAKRCSLVSIDRVRAGCLLVCRCSAADRAVRRCSPPSASKKASLSGTARCRSRAAGAGANATITVTVAGVDGDGPRGRRAATSSSAPRTSGRVPARPPSPTVRARSP